MERTYSQKQIAEDMILAKNQNASFCKCVITWIEDDESEIVTIKLNDCVIEDEDEDIFFYCNKITDLASLCCKTNGEDFYIDEFLDFF